MAHTLITLADAAYSVAGTDVLTAVTSVIHTGDVLFIAGKSGSGKSTLLKILEGIINPTGGTVQIRGINLKQATSRELNRLHEQSGFVFQDSALISNMTIFENIALPLQYRRELDENEITRRVMSIISEMGIEQDTHNRPAQLSVGEQRLAAIARALITDPDLIFFDEPITGVDSIRARKITELLKTLRDRGKTMVIISHRRALMNNLGTRLWILKDGKLSVDTPFSGDHIFSIADVAEIVE